MRNSNYLGRGIHSKKFIDSLTHGHLAQMLKVVNKDKDLDVQIRNNYLNIYYQGGNIARVKSENSVEFDMFYFYLDMKNTPKKEIEKNTKITTELKNKRISLTEKFKKRNYNAYFTDAKEIMDKWLEINPKPERKDQHLLSIENQYNISDYTIVDIEYQVSVNSDFACMYIPDGKIEPKKPRFDIIAINKQGKIFVIELKKGVAALKNTSGLQEHWDCYQESIGRNPSPFVNEIKKLLEQKQAFDLIDMQLEIKDPEPEFMFAYAYDKKKTIREQDRIFDNQYRKIKSTIPVIKIKDGEFKLLES